PGSSNESTRLLLGGNDEQNQLKQAGFIPRTCQLWLNDKGGMEICGVWEKGTAEWEMRWALNPQQYDVFATDQAEWDAALLNGRYIGLWRFSRDIGSTVVQ